MTSKQASGLTATQLEALCGKWPGVTRDIKWGTDLEQTEDGKKEGKFIWYGTISPGEEVVLVSEWDVRAPVYGAEWRIKSE